MLADFVFGSMLITSIVSVRVSVLPSVGRRSIPTMRMLMRACEPLSPVVSMPGHEGLDRRAAGNADLVPREEDAVDVGDDDESQIRRDQGE